MINLKIVSYGNLDPLINEEKLKKWKSRLFRILPHIEHPRINEKADTCGWCFSDRALISDLPDKDELEKTDEDSSEIDFVMYITTVGLEGNYFSRILSPDQVVISTYEIGKILEEAKIPIENYIIAMANAYSLIYLTGDFSMNMEARLAHDDARGCIFDMCGKKEEIVFSCIQPCVCDKCKELFISNRISPEKIDKVNSELKKLNRTVYNRMVLFIKRRPILSLAISALSAILLNLLSNLIFKILTE